MPRGSADAIAFPHPPSMMARLQNEIVMNDIMSSSSTGHYQRGLPPSSTKLSNAMRTRPAGRQNISHLQFVFTPDEIQASKDGTYHQQLFADVPMPQPRSLSEDPTVIFMHYTIHSSWLLVSDGSFVTLYHTVHMVYRT
jgi:hypothetical protein